MPELKKIAVFVDDSGNVYRKATTREAAGDDDVVKGTVKDTPGFYKPTTFEAVVEKATS